MSTSFRDFAEVFFRQAVCPERLFFYLTTFIGSFPLECFFSSLFYSVAIFLSVLVQCFFLFCLGCCRAPFCLWVQPFDALFLGHLPPNSFIFSAVVFWVFAELGFIDFLAFSSRASLELRSVSFLPVSFQCPVFTQFLFCFVLLCSGCSTAFFSGLSVTFSHFSPGPTSTQLFFLKDSLQSRL